MNISQEIRDLLAMSPCTSEIQDQIWELEDTFCWVEVSKYCYISESAIDAFRDELDWEFIGVSNDPEEWAMYEDCGVFTYAYSDYKYDLIDERREILTPEFISRFVDYVNWDVVSTMIRLVNYSLIEPYKENLNWVIISFDYCINSDLIKDYPEFIRWDCLALNDDEAENPEYYLEDNERAAIIESLIRKYADKISNWTNVSRTINRYYPYFSNSLIFDLRRNLDWDIVIGYKYRHCYSGMYHELSDDVIAFSLEYLPKYIDYKAAIERRNEFMSNACDALTEIPQLNTDVIEHIMNYL